MRKILRRSALAAAGILPVVSAAQAADAPAAPPAGAAAPWDGPYVGGHVALVFGSSRFSNTPAEPPSSGVSQVKNLDTQLGPLSGGLQIGWNHRLPLGWLVGVEADVTFPDKMLIDRTVAQASGLYRYVNEAMPYGSARGRAGAILGNWLVYATGGFAFERELGTRAQILGTPFGGTAMPGDVDTTYSWRYGWAAGAGAEVRLAPQWTAKIEYLYDHFGATGAFYPLAAQRVTSDLQIHNVRLGINYHFGEPAAEEGDVPGILPNLDMFSVHGQTTQIGQATLPFRALYSGQNSLDPAFQKRETVSLTAYLGYRPWEGTEFYFNPEPFQGFGLSATHGLAGFSNGEAQKGGFDYPHYNTARLFMRQTFGFGGEQESVDDGANQFGGKVDVSRLTFTVGKIAVPDFFDNNQYAHDARQGFLNWSIWEGGAFDYAADQKGYTWGAVAELNQKQWAARAGYVLEPTAPNGNDIDTRIGRRGQYIGELEGRYSIFEQAGKVRVTAWFAKEYSGSFNEVDSNPVYGGDITLTRKTRPESGFIVNLEQAVTDDLGVFARYSKRDGNNEIMAWTDIDKSLSAGAVLKGTSWDRPKDRIGVAFAVNGLSDNYRLFLSNGGLGVNIGDGALTYRRESLVEAYYALNLNQYSTLSLDYQYVANPAYNADRGPVSIIAARLHSEF